jgi:hypothetical protein
LSTRKSRRYPDYPPAQREEDVLSNLRESGHEWHTPMMIGGTDGSHHSATLARLVKKGLAERKPRSGSTSGRGYVASWLYRAKREGM